MNKGLIASFFSFLLGGGIGAVVSIKILNKKYKDLADKEIESVKKSLELYYGSKPTIAPEKEKENSKEENKKNNFLDKDSIDMNSLKSKNNDANPYHKSFANIAKEEGYSSSKPYIIPPEVFADSDWNLKTLHYYADGVLADDEMNIIKDIKGTVGDDALTSFGRFEADAVYVRDEINEIDYEILLEEEKFSDVKPKANVGVFPGDDD